MMRMNRYSSSMTLAFSFICLFLFPNVSSIAFADSTQSQLLHWTNVAPLPTPETGHEAAGFVGAFMGRSNSVTLIAGGESHTTLEQLVSDEVFVLLPSGNALNSVKWKSEIKLPKPIAHGASVTTDRGLLCLGGFDGTRALADVVLLSWESESETVEQRLFPSLPIPCRNGAAAVIGSTVYFVGNITNETGEAQNIFWTLDISVQKPVWRELPLWPDANGELSLITAQHNGETDCLYILSRGSQQRKSADDAETISNSLWEFNPLNYDRSIKSRRDFSPWRKRTIAQDLVAVSTAALGQGFIYVFAKESAMDKNRVYLYHTITDAWIDAGETPAPLAPLPTLLDEQNQMLVVSKSLRKGDQAWFLWSASPLRQIKPFGSINFIVLIAYLAAMAGVGLYFMKKNKNTDDYFRGGQNIPWWVAGCSIFATMLSSITYMALPSKGFASDWTYLLGFPLILLVSVFVIYKILPFFRRINATSAYEYLELRFNLGTRLLGSGLFILFHIGRMAIVLYLSALALASITPLTEIQAILIMGLFSLLYSTLGGIEAVVWTDTIQTFVLFGGAIVILIFALMSIDGGVIEMVNIAAAEGKFKAVHWDWDRMSYTATALWVIIIGGIGQNLVSYTSDQAVVQRYMTTPDQKTAAKAILTNGLLSQPVGLLFLILGAALFAFYKTHPTHLDPTFKIDAVMPMFIAQELPVGIAGLIVAGIFAATQSTISTSMNSTSTAFITDFMRRFSLLSSEKNYFNLARFMTLFFGSAGVGLAILLASADIKSMLDSFLSVIGLFGGALAGMFLLGIFTKRANGIGVFIGACIGGLVLYLVQATTQTHVYIYASIGLSASMIIGYIVSLIIPTQNKKIDGLTIYSLNSRS